jgi:hypothetical protein
METKDDQPRRVSVLALPNESTGTPTQGLFETLMLDDAVVKGPNGVTERLFEVEIVGPERGIFPSACGLPRLSPGHFRRKFRFPSGSHAQSG